MGDRCFSRALKVGILYNVLPSLMDIPAGSVKGSLAQWLSPEQMKL
jgi:hypothetical protein